MRYYSEYIIRYNSLVQNSQEGFINVPGGKIWYKIVGNGKKIPILMLHGGPGYPSNSLQTLTNLANERKVIFYDQLGCGRSDRPTDKSLWKIERFIEELHAVKKTLRLDRFILLGHSWGSMLATAYTLKYPSSVKSLILSGPFLSVSRWIADAESLKKSLPEKIQAIINEHEKNKTTDSKEYKKAALEFYKQHLCRIYPYPKSLQEEHKNAGIDAYLTMWGPSEFYCNGNLKGYDLTPQLHSIKIPVLLLCGIYDEATPKTVKYYKSLFPNASMVVFKKSSHMTYLEEPENYIETVEKFIEKID